MQTPQQGTNNIFDGASSSFGQQNPFGLQQPIQNTVVSLRSTPNKNPFGTLLAKPQITIGRSSGSGPSVQYGISSMPVSEKPTQVRVNTLLTPRHITQRSKVRMHARKYHPEKDSPKVSSSSDGDDALSNPKADAMSVPRESPRSTLSYPYIPLNSEQNEIRLLQLQPPIKSQPLRGSIIHVPLSAELRYWALSYCWGGIAWDRTIILDGEELLITVNLDDALRQLGNSYGLLWVDAICINQKDEAERWREVRRMGEIYSLASGVAAWLGVANRTSDRAMDFVEVLATKAPRSQYEEYMKELPSENDPGKFEEEWVALKDLSKNGYWSREWILFELPLCRGSKIVHFGPKSLPWKYFETVFCPRNDDPIFNVADECIEHVIFDSQELREVGVGVQSIRVLCKFQGRGFQSIYIPAVLRLKFLVADAFEKLYFSLGMGVAPRMSIPYTNFATYKDEVFRDLTKEMLANGSNLDLICLKLPTHDYRADVASWVPHWNVHGLWTQSPNFLVQPILDNNSRIDYSAETVISYVGNGSILRVRGISYDRVDGLGSTETFNWLLGTDKTKTKMYDAVKPDHSRNAYGSDVDTFRALKELSREIFRDSWISSGAPQDEDSLNDEFLIPRLYQQRAFMDHDSPRTKSALEWLQRATEFSFESRNLQEWYQMAYTHGQALPSTSSTSVVLKDPQLDGMLRCLGNVELDQWRWLSTGRGYLGRTHPQTQKGDEIVIVQGCTVPMVLRPCGKHYKVVCAAYVQGIMNGEALQGVSDDQMQYFDLV